MKTTYAALVVGAGVAGIRAALDLAETGQKVALVDRKPHLGGLLTQLDYQFPTNACGMCKMLPLTERDSSSQFCMRKGLFHKNIDIYLSTELTALDGDPGQFTAFLRQGSSFVDPTKCIGCGACSAVCPVRVPSEFNAGLTERAAVHLPVPHNIPNSYVVDLDHCLRCWRCHEACPTEAIDFKFARRSTFHVLLASAEPGLAESVAEMLKDQLFPFSAAATPEEALDQATKNEKLAMLLLDLDLPGLEPERFLARALELKPELEVALLAGPEHADLAGKLRMAGARLTLEKPIKPKTAVPALDKAFLRAASEKRLELSVAAVVLATGFDTYTPCAESFGADTLGYKALPGVVTSVEFERMLSGSGPGRDKLARPGDGKPIRRIAWLQCVGSRDVAKGADFCSSVCCMISIKEAMLARRMLKDENGEPAAATIFSMDMRTFGRDYQRYRDTAAEEAGVRFVKSRIHTAMPSPDDPGALRLRYMDDAGILHEEDADLLVLAVGARPPKDLPALARAAQVELNDYGFLRTRHFDPSRTTRLGVFAAGSAGAPRDIAESLITAGAAAMEASRLINIYAPLKEKVAEPEPEYRDVGREAPRVLVALCTSCPVLESAVDMEALIARLETQPAVTAVARIDAGCTTPGWEKIAELAGEKRPNRILIGACMPYAYVPRLRELGARLGLNPAFMDVTDIYTPAMAAANEEDPEARAALGREVFASLNMALAKLVRADTQRRLGAAPVYRQALVVGGGLAGMTAAVGIADHGYPVTLVESEEALGGNAIKLRTTLEGRDPQRYMADLVEQVQKHPNITVRTDSRVVLSMGRAGAFSTVVYGADGVATIEHGATILATGGREAKVYDYGFRVHPATLTQRELEDRLASGALDAGALNSVAMIQCWRSREEGRNYCSRICCAGALKNLHTLFRKNPNLKAYVFYRDIMSYGFMEHFYTEARRLGAIFIRYSLKQRPRVEFDNGHPIITAYDPVLGEELQIRPDILALSGGVEPNEVEELAEQFGVPLTEDGFYREAEPKWRPVDFLKYGVFMAGLARAPGNMGEHVASAKAAAQRALRILSGERLDAGNVVAEVRHSLCSRCGRCIDVCPYGARRMNLEDERIEVDAILCQGCGSCTAVCPNSAAVLRGFDDAQVMGSIDAALEELA
jgi:heterodisulfide reductase subunit A